MICPRCNSNQSDEIKFCTSCGANLQAVREAVAAPEASNKFDWGNTWVAEMFMSGQAQELRKLEMERRMGVTPEIKRYNEIKAGVITSSVGVGLAIFLFVFMQGLIGAGVAPHAASILGSLWIAGVIPFLVGIALMLNGLVVSKRMVEIQRREINQRKANALDAETATQRSLRPADTNEFVPPGFSVTDQTTRHLVGSRSEEE
jgi:hypothetical protein